MNTNSVNNAGQHQEVVATQTELPDAVAIVKIALDSAQVGIWVIELSTRKFLPSSRTKALFGFSDQEEMSLADALQQVVLKHRKTVADSFELALKEQSNIYVECPVVGLHDSKDRWLSITGGVSNPEGGNGYFSGIILDITQQKQNEVKRSKFIGIVSHELKTPLTALKAYIQLLNNWAKKQKDNFSIGALSKVERQVKKMLAMVNSLLNLSGAEAGKIPLNKQEFILNELIGDVIEEMLFIVSSRAINFVPCEDIAVNADRDKIEQVLVNLISNAAKYSEKDMPIEISCTGSGKTVEVSIRDQGFGIAPHHIDKLFLPHYRVETKETENIDGFGIGLYLCSEIIRGHKGKIWVESEVGKGSTFKFSIPV